MPRMDSFRSGTKNSRMVEAQYRICIFCFLSAPNFAKRKRMEQAEDSSPDPSSSACEIRNQPRFCGNHIPRKMLPQNRVRIVFVLPSFSFWKSSVLRTEALQRNGCTTLVVLVIWIFFEKHSNFVQQIPQQIEIKIRARNAVAPKARHWG